jgi:hypothetical protein
MNTKKPTNLTIEKGLEKAKNHEEKVKKKIRLEKRQHIFLSINPLNLLVYPLYRKFERQLGKDTYGKDKKVAEIWETNHYFLFMNLTVRKLRRVENGK